MGKQLVRYYDEAYAIGGLVARVRLAVLTKMPSSEAEHVKDEPGVVAAFESAMKTVRSEWSSKGQKRFVENAGTTRRLDEAYGRIEALFGQGGLTSESALRTITETIANALGVERASVWYYDDQRTSIRCADLFSRKTGEHSSGVELFERDFKPYFEALRCERTIAADDANTDPRTAAFSAPYLRPLGITSMLDVPIWRAGRMVGVICHEHTGPARHWDAAEEDFAYRTGGLIQRVLSTAR